VPALTPAVVRKQIKDGTPAPVYLLQGEDDVEKSALAGDFADLVEDGLRAFNVERIHAGEITTGDQIADAIRSLIDAVRTLPMLSARRVVTVFQAENLLTPKRESEAAGRALKEFEALLEKPEPQTTLVLVAASIDRRRSIFKVLSRQAAIVECGAPEDVAAAERWVRTRVAAAGMAIDPAADRKSVV